MKLPRSAAVILAVYSCLSTLPAADQIHASQEPSLTKRSETYFAGDGDEADQHEDFWTQMAQQKYLLGDLWGARDEISQAGFGVTLTYVSNIAGNPVGGISRGFTETDSTGLNVSADFEKIVGWQGLTGFVSAAYRQGTSLSRTRIGNVINVQQVYGGETFHLVNLYLEQTFLDDRASFKAGRIAQFDDFSHDYAFGYYMNNAFDGQPVGFFFQGPFTAYPTVTWGAIGKYGQSIGENLGVYTFLGVYGADTRLPENQYHGARMSFDFNEGANIMAEVGIKRNWARGQQGLPGKYSIGGWWFTGDFSVFSGAPPGAPGTPAPTKSGIGGFYYLIHQGLYREGTGDEVGTQAQASQNATYWGDINSGHREVQGLFFWTSGQFAGGSTSQMDAFLSAGLFYRGLIPSRDQDVLALGYYYGFFSDDFAASQQRMGQLPQSYETAVELGYRYNVTDYFYVQPNIQAIFNPGGRGDIGDALVLGAQIEVDF